MAEERITTPQSSAGLMRFYDVSSSNIQLDPRLVFGFALAFLVLEILLHVLRVG
jgi:preprotein translocase subunit Sec61beta